MKPGGHSDEAAGGAAMLAAPPAAVLFDADYTLFEPGDQFEAAGYRRTGARFGLDLDPALWPRAVAAAHKAAGERRRETGHEHDEGLIDVIARAVIGGLGGGDPDAVTATVLAISDAWCRVESFSLYDDALPCLTALHGAGVRLALVSNAVGHDLDEMVAAKGLGELVETVVTSSAVGVTKPAPAIFAEALRRLGVPAGAAVMVGDSYEDDVRGGLAAGLGAAVLLDRAGRPPRHAPTIRSLAELPGLLGLEGGR